MPTISSFHGMMIRMYWDDHAPPHFHVDQGSWEAAIAISDGRSGCNGGSPPAALLGSVPSTDMNAMRSPSTPRPGTELHDSDVRAHDLHD